MASSMKEDSNVVIKKDWYQSDLKVFITIFGKHSSSNEDCSVQFGANELTVQAKFATGQPYTLNLKLSKNIVPERSSYRLLSSKLEIVLAKTNTNKWDMLEQTVVNTPSKLVGQGRNWDKVVNKMTVDDDESDIDTAFKKIYSEGNDEVRKAMNKSFMESGGTVLSTDWKDIGSNKTEMNTPDCMEWKKWNE